MTSSLEDIKSIDIEEWLTLNTASSPTKLKQGQSPNMQDVWVDEKPGSVISAPGFHVVGVIPSNNPPSFCINYFKTSSGTQTFVVSDNATVWTTIDFQAFTPIIVGLSFSFQLRGAVIRDKLWLTNGSDAVRTFDGTSVVLLDGTGGTPNVPRGRYISYHDERVWIYHVSSARSAAYFSSLTDSGGAIIAPDNVNAWDTVDNFLQISEGDADFGTGMILYRGYLFFFKQYSIWRLVGYDEYTYSRVKTRASTGTRFNESLQELDSLIHLIGVDGVYVFDGEESVRISDIIDPATASQTAFGFNQLQQPNQNNQFWEVASTADWNAGTVPTDISVNDEIDLVAADDSQANFQAGATQTNLDLISNPGAIQLALTNSGFSTPNIALNKDAAFTSFSNASQIGSASFFTDGNLVNQAGISANNGGGTFSISLPTNSKVSRIIFRGVRTGFGFGGLIQIDIPPGGIAHAITISAVSGGGATIQSSGIAAGKQINIPASAGPFDLIVDLSVTTTSSLIFFFDASTLLTCTEVQVFQTAYNTTGKFTSKTLDLGIIPTSLGTLSATETLNGQTASYFTQSSVDGVTWAAETAVSNGGAIASTPQRYLRWGVNLTSDGTFSPTIDATYLPAVYISAIHDTGGSILAWGPLESNRSLAGQTISYYYRGATTSIGVSSASWNVIVPGGVLGFSTSFRYIQFKIEISGGDSTHLPIVSSVTINWTVGTVGQPPVLQNVASAVWRNRYYLSASGPGASANNVVLVRGKKTFGSPWMLKSWPILSFTRFQDSFYGGHSGSGAIFKLDTGYSRNANTMDSYFETGDFLFGGFTANLVEILVEVERSGPWNLLLGVSVDGGRTFDDFPVDLTPNGYDSNYVKRIVGNGVGGTTMSYTTTRFRLRFRTNGIDTPFQVHRCIVFYKLSGIRGSIRGDYI